jgi:dTDP-4-dehydrorhamnose reductase
VPFEYGAVDMCDRSQILDSVRAFQPQAIVHCAVLSGQPLMYRERQLAWRSYVDATRYLTEAAREVGAKMILVSTDWVFDGTQAPADETTPPNPINYYGVLKVVGETLLTSMSENWAVARVASVNGIYWAQPERPMQQTMGMGNFMKVVADGLQKNRSFTAWDGSVNLFATPSLATDVADMVLKIIQLDRVGIFHCCGGEGISRLELARKTAEGFGFDPDWVRSGPCDAAYMDTVSGIPIPHDTRLRATRTAKELQHPLLNIRQIVTELRKQLETGSL